MGIREALFAIEVARKTGLPEDVIMDSAERIGTEFANMDNLLQSIVRDKLYWEKKRKEVEVSEGQSCSDCVGKTLNENRDRNCCRSFSCWNWR